MALTLGSLALCATTTILMTTTADARPRHRHVSHHQAGHQVKYQATQARKHTRKHTRMPMQAQTGIVFDNDGKPTYVGPAMRSATAQTASRTAMQPARKMRRSAQAGHSFSSAGGASFGSSSLVSTARSYLGTNPTGRRSLWCGAFMDLVLKKNGHAGGGNLAKAYARYGRRVSGPQVGAIAVMNRRGGGHVGVVSGVDANGNPIIISGNHNRTVAETVYPRGRITAYVVPN